MTTINRRTKLEDTEMSNRLPRTYPILYVIDTLVLSITRTMSQNPSSIKMGIVGRALSIANTLVMFGWLPRLGYKVGRKERHVVKIRETQKRHHAGVQIKGRWRKKRDNLSPSGVKSHERREAQFTPACGNCFVFITISITTNQCGHPLNITGGPSAVPMIMTPPSTLLAVTSVKVFVPGLGNVILAVAHA